MAYLARFIEVDALIAQVKPMIASITDSMTQSNIGVMLSVRAVTAYELAIKDILEDFSRKKHIVFGTYVNSTLSRINGRIQYNDLMNSLITPFGNKYLTKFKLEIEKQKKIILKSEGKDLINTYNNLILARNKYVHGGTITMTYQEIIDSYEIGKNVIHSVYKSMRR